MRNKKTINIVISNILLLTESILLFFIVILFSSRISILSKNTIIKKLNKTNYYEKTYNLIKENMEYTSTKSAISKRVLYDIFYIEDIKNDTNKYIKGIYNNKEIEININKIEERLIDNLEEYEEEKNIEISNSKKESYIKKITSIYKNEITLMNEFNNTSKTINRQISFINLILPILIIDLAALVLVNRKIFKKYELYVPAFSSAIALLISTIYIGIHKVFIYDNKVTEIVNEVIKKGIIVNIIFIIFLTILGVLSLKLIKEKEEIIE